MPVIKNISFHIKENSFIGKLAAWKLKSHQVAIDIGKTVHLHNCTAEAFLQSERWVKHELCHLQQFQQYGFLPFIFEYLVESMKHGYYKNKFEVEAREAEDLDMK